MFHIFILVGESGSGKTTLQQALGKLEYNVVKGYVTRAMREGESPGNPYNFIKKRTFLDKIYAQEIIEHVEIEGNLYGTSMKEFDLNNNNIVVLEPRGISQFQEMFGIENITIVYLCTPEEERIKRMFETRSKESVEKRLETDKKMFKDLYKISDYKIDCGTKEENLIEMLSIIREVIEEKREANV